MTQILEFDGVAVTLAGGQVSAAGRSIRLSGRESALLYALTAVPGQLVSKPELRTLVWGPTSRVSINTVEACMGALRRKLTRIGLLHPLQTVHGRGYRLNASGHTRTPVGTPRTQQLHLGTVMLTLDPVQVSVAGQSVQLSRRESALLHALAQRMGGVVSREELLRLVWDPQHPVTGNAVEVYIGYLRVKLDQLGIRHLLHTVRGRGYQLADTPTRSHQPSSAS